MMGDAMLVRGHSDPLAPTYIAKRMDELTRPKSQQGTGTPPRGHSKNTSVGDESAAWAGVATRSGPASESTRSSAQASDVSAGLEPARGPRSSSADGDAPLDIRSVGSEESDAGNGLSDDAVPAAHVPLVFNGPAGPGHAAGGTGLAAARMFVVDAVVQSRAGHRSMVSLVGSILETDHVALPGLALEEACAPAAPVEGRYAENVDRGFPDASTSGPGSAAGAARVRVVRGGVRLTVRYEPPSPKFRQKNPGMVSFRVAVSEQPAQESESSESTAFLYSMRGMSGTAWHDPDLRVLVWDRLALLFRDRKSEDVFVKIVGNTVAIKQMGGGAEWARVARLAPKAAICGPSWVAEDPGDGGWVGAVCRAVSDWRFMGAVVTVGAFVAVTALDRRSGRGALSGVRRWAASFVQALTG